MPGEGVWTPCSGIGVERLEVDGDESVGREMVRSVMHGEGLGVGGCGFGDPDYGVVEAEGLELWKIVTQEHNFCAFCLTGCGTSEHIRHTMIARHRFNLGNAVS